MGTYNLPRSVKGEGRILFIFTGKSMLYTVAGGMIGFLLFYIILSILGFGFAGLIMIVICALIGFIIGSLKMPNLEKFDFTRKTGGENIDDIIKRAIKFKTKGKKIYVYKEEETNAKCEFFNNSYDYMWSYSIYKL